MKSKYLTNVRSATIVITTMIAIFVLYTLVINYIFVLEFTGSTLLLTFYVLSFCFLDILLLLWHDSIISNNRSNIKISKPVFWKRLYLTFTYFYISIRGLYFLALFLFSIYIAAPIIGMFYFGQYTLDNVINSDRHGKELGLGFCRYGTFVLDNQLYVESLENEDMISISKVYFWGLFKKRVFFIKYDNVDFKELSEKNVVLLRENHSSYTLKIEKFKDYYKLYCNESGHDTKEYTIFK